MFAGWPGHRTSGEFQEYPPLDPGTVHRNAELLFILGTLFLSDIVTTQVILRMGGVELNPFMTGVVSDPALHLSLKTMILLLIFFVSLIAEQRMKGSSVFFYGIIILFYSAILLNNLLYILPRIAG
jgi:hypothetical protein